LKSTDLEPAHPGELLEEIVIPATGKSKAEIAELLGVSRQTLYDIRHAGLALRLGKLFGDGPQVWLRMQMEHDLWTLTRKNEDKIAKIPTLTAA
jgi:antitoxin HigA-1